MSTPHPTQHNGVNRVSGDGSDSRGIADLIRELRDESTALIREEVALAKTEMSEKASVVGRNSGMLVAGGAIAHLGLIFLLLALSYGLYVAIGSAGLPVHALWIAPLIVGLVVGGIGLAMFLKAKDTLANVSPVPKRTVESLKEDKQWATDKVS
ncbi:phage holin family protein [Roseimaritima sediminicola]|uniref:phage holin family protein n=1 Tax=Roseimaritima sediminicola TaxID=2662066 RepID=UPI00129856B8|nr:phage holin family protein [Roseimaritima sediminicola]